MNEVFKQADRIEIPVRINGKEDDFLLEQDIAAVLPFLWIELVMVMDNRLMLRNIFTGEPFSLYYDKDNGLCEWGIDFFSETLNEVRRKSIAKSLTYDNYHNELTHFFNVLYNKFFDYCYKQGTVFTWKMGSFANTFIADMCYPEKAIMIADGNVYEFYNQPGGTYLTYSLKTYQCVSPEMQQMLEVRRGITLRGIRTPGSYNKTMQDAYTLKRYYLEKERLNAINGKGPLVLQSKS